jgi:YHS domain-containing protein
MKKLKFFGGCLLPMAFLCLVPAARAEGTNLLSSTNSISTKLDLLTTCPVSGDKLTKMGKPCVFVYKGQEVKLCCPNCKDDFDKNPDKYMKLIRAADKAQKK